MGAEIRTVMGPIPPGELGFTSMHEHVLLDLTVYRRMNEDRFSEEDIRRMTVLTPARLLAMA